jgi:hypothetical protein
MATRGEPRQGRQTKVNQLRCIRCECTSGLYATGWRGYRMDDPKRDEAPVLAFFCPTCSEAEFGPSKPKP